MICRPIIEYGHVVFNSCRKAALNNIEVAERSALRKITKIRHPNNPLHNPSNQLLYEKQRRNQFSQGLIQIQQPGCVQILFPES
ncbi:hypothetical protein NQ317_007617 [Molorchus minor]|uniref:Uncharacterized protein n=1 Tax=Molorchus minor TaxID=1323400 RepID=A0ABQ9J081_9CUCU|nr:hypothetical protein NQ317_007617 [Molorchus minor]